MSNRKLTVIFISMLVVYVSGVTYIEYKRSQDPGYLIYNAHMRTHDWLYMTRGKYICTDCDTCKFCKTAGYINRK